MSRRVLAGAAVLTALAWPGLAAAAPCPAAPEPDAADQLPLLRPALKPAGQLDVLVIGSSLASAKDAANTGYVGEMAHALEASVHGLHVSLTFDGRHFMRAADMLGVLSADVARHHYGLVLWQTGTADAVGDEPAGDFFQALSDGAVAAASAGAALVLIDPQYSRFLEANADLGPYLSSMQAVASTSGALLFDRYALMRDWSEAGAIDLESAAPAARPAVAARLHACLGQALARTLLASVAQTQ